MSETGILWGETARSVNSKPPPALCIGYWRRRHLGENMLCTWASKQSDAARHSPCRRQTVYRAGLRVDDAFGQEVTSDLCRRDGCDAMCVCVRVRPTLNEVSDAHCRYTLRARCCAPRRRSTDPTERRAPCLRKAVEENKCRGHPAGPPPHTAGGALQRNGRACRVKSGCLAGTTRGVQPELSPVDRRKGT